MSFCPPCKRQERLARFALVLILLSFVAGSFFAGRATTPRQPLQFIGKPIELQNAGDTATDEANESPANGVSAEADKQAVAVQEEALTNCGAPTKAGHPCRRKVRGGGYCWQHKDNFKAKAKASQ